jgi:hypothetical protein
MSAKASLLVAQYSGERTAGKAGSRAWHYRHAVSFLAGKELGQDLAVAAPPLEDPAIALKKTNELEASYGG